MVAQIKADRSPTLLPVQRGKAPMHIITAPHRSLYAEVKAQALRLAGQGTPVLIVEFFQGGAQQGLELPRVLGQNLTWMRCNTQRRLDRLPPDAPLTDAETSSFQALWQVTRQALRDGTFELFILDELDRAIARNLITETELLSSLDARSERVEVILTGSTMPQSLLEQADQVTHYRNFKGNAGESKLGAVPPA